jgi:hypothetical protein
VQCCVKPGLGRAQRVAASRLSYRPDPSFIPAPGPSVSTWRTIGGVVAGELRARLVRPETDNMHEFAPARVCPMPPFGVAFVGDWALSGSLCRVRVCQGRLCQGGVCRATLCRDPAVCQARVCRKVVFVGVHAFSGDGILRGAVSRGRGFLGAGGLSARRFSVGPVWPRPPLPVLVVLRRLVTRDEGL